MAYTGKATYDDSDSMFEDVSDLVTLNSPRETPFLDFIGNPERPVTQTKHEWLEDSLNAYSDTAAEAMDASETGLDVTDGTKFLAGDIIMQDYELMSVSSISTNTLTVVRGYGSSTAATHSDATTVYIVARPALEGGDAPTAANTNRSRLSNYTQIFTRAVDVSGTVNSSSQIGGFKEYEHQKEVRLIECMRELELSTINGSKASSTPQGSDTVRRTMQGLKYFCSTNVNNASSATLTESLWRGYLRSAWDNGAQDMDFALVPAFQKSLISGFKQAATRWDEGAKKHSVVTDFYESDFGTIKLILCRWLHPSQIIIGSSKNIQVMPLQGRSFFHKPLAQSGDYEKGQVIGEYTMEVRNEASHALIHTLATS